jgi:hypothetical protein
LLSFCTCDSKVIQLLRGRECMITPAFSNTKTFNALSTMPQCFHCKIQEVTKLGPLFTGILCLLVILKRSKSFREMYLIKRKQFFSRFYFLKMDTYWIASSWQFPLVVGKHKKMSAIIIVYFAGNVTWKCHKRS